MKVNKIKTHELEKCYSICPLTYNGTEHMLVAAEKVNKCLLFDLDGNLEETVSEHHGRSYDYGSDSGKRRRVPCYP